MFNSALILPIHRSGARAGFTLIELLIVMVVAAILAAIAIPAYTDSVQKARRGQAKADMVEVVQAMERCFTNRTTYLACFPLNALPAPLAASPGGSTGTSRFYGLALADVTAADYSVVATPVNSQANDLCMVLTMRQNGLRETSSTRTDCW